MRRIAAILLPSAIVWLSSFAKTGAKPVTWLDHPFDKTTLPLARTVIMAHASDDSAGGRFGADVIEGQALAPGKYAGRLCAVNGCGNDGSLPSMFSTY